jgi:hypothetical protein
VPRRPDPSRTLGRSEKRAGEFALPPGTLLFPDKGEDFAKPRDAHAVTRTFVRHAKRLGFEMRFHDIAASHLTILPDNGVAIPTVNARNTPIRANIVGSPQCRNQDQGFHGRQPFRRFVLCLRKLRDVGPGIFKRDELAAHRAAESLRRTGATSP